MHAYLPAHTINSDHYHNIINFDTWPIGPSQKVSKLSIQALNGMLMVAIIFLLKRYVASPTGSSSPLCFIRVIHI